MYEQLQNGKRSIRYLPNRKYGAEVEPSFAANQLCLTNLDLPNDSEKRLKPYTDDVARTHDGLLRKKDTD